MKIFTLELLDPKAKGLLDELVRLNLIRLEENEEKDYDFKKLISKLRRIDKLKPSAEEIQKEVIALRKKRYAKQPK
jgi:hypothetical protein